MKTFLVQKLADNGVSGVICSEGQLIHDISMSDCYNEEYRIFDISTFGEIREVFYKGWQPNCLIEVIDNMGNIVASGYGIEH